MKVKVKTIIFLILSCVITALAINCELKKQKEEQMETVKVVFEEPEPEPEYVDAWVKSTLLVREDLNADSKIIDKYHFGKKVEVEYINKYWAKEKDTGYYLNRKFLSCISTDYTDYDVPSNNGIKSYMDYRTITSKESKQYKLQENAITENNGIRMVNGRYCIALGSYYTTKIGHYVDVELENGNIINAILADCKDNEHTDETNRIHKEDSSVVEFVIDKDVMNNKVLTRGDVSYINDWDSKVVNIRVYNKVEDF